MESASASDAEENSEDDDYEDEDDEEDDEEADDSDNSNSEGKKRKKSAKRKDNVPRIALTVESFYNPDEANKFAKEIMSKPSDDPPLVKPIII